MMAILVVLFLSLGIGSYLYGLQLMFLDFLNSCRFRSLVDLRNRYLLLQFVL